MVLGVASLGLNALRKFHVDVRLNGSLGISHNEVNLTKSPAEDDAHNYHKPDCEPGNNRRIGLEIIHPKNLLSTMKIQSGLMLGDLVGGEVALTAQGPY